MSDGDKNQDNSQPIINISQNIDSMSGGTVIGHQTNITKQTVRTCPPPPSTIDHFTGRVEEIKTLREQLTGTHIVAISAVRSMGGMGKTTLARHLANVLWNEKVFSAVLWAEITQNPQIASILLTWGQHADSEYRLPAETPLEQIADHVRAMLTDLVNNHCGGRTLVILDDVWEDSLAAVEILRRAAPTGAQILITTRQDQVVNDPRIKARTLSLNELSEPEAKTLLQKLISHPAITDAHLDRTVHLLKGHPLALELAAASLNLAEDTGHINDILDDYAKGIAEGSPFDAMNLEAETPRSLNVVFGRSYNALAADLQSHFRTLGILAPDSAWDRPLAGAVWDMNDEKAVRSIHQALRTRALIAADEIYGDGWYRQHPLLQTYARALLNRPENGDQQDQCFNRYADFVIEQAAQFDELPLEQWTQLEPLLPHVQEVGDGLVKKFNALNPRPLLPNAALGEGGNTEEGDMRAGGVGEGLRPSPTGADESDALLQRAGDFAWNVTRYVNKRPQMIEVKGTRVLRGLNWLEMGLAVFRQQGNQRHEALFLNEIALAWSALGEKRKALDFYEQALPLYQAVGDRGGEATTLNNIGGAWSDLGEMRKALDFYEQALPLYKAVGDRRGEAVTLNNIGGAWDDLGEKRKALDFYEQALPLRRAVGDRGGEAATLTNIGLVWSALGEKRKALDFYQQALPLSRAVGDRGGEATTLNNIGMAWSALGEKRKALDFYQQALPLSRAVADRRGEAVTLNNIGGAWSDLGEKRKALDFYEQALPLRRAVGDRGGEAATLNNMAAIYFHEGNLQEAAEVFQQIIEIVHAMGAVSEEAAFLLNIAVVYQQMGWIDKATQSAEAGRDILIRYNLPQNASGNRVADYDAFLAELRGEPSQEDQFAQVMHMLAGLYAEGGAAAVREALAGQVDAAVIDQVIAALERGSE